MGWTGGTTYYILLDDEDNTTGTHSFYISCPSAPDPCSSVTTIGGCGSSYTQTYTGGGTGVWNNSSDNPCGYATPGIEKIYKFVAPTTGTYSIQVTAASGYVDYLWRRSSCSSSGWTCIDDINSTGQFGAMEWTGGTTYYILLDDEDNTTGTHTFNISLLTAIESFDQDNIKIYPNPARNELLFEINGFTGVVEYEIINSAGLTLLKSNISVSKTIQLNTIPSGYYVIKFKVKDSYNIKSFVKD